MFEFKDSVLYIQKKLFEFSKMAKTIKIKKQNLKETQINQISSTSQEKHIIRCICNYSHNDGDMICCDKCDVWQHIVCMGLDHNELPEEYYCEKCSPREIDVGKAKDIQEKRKAELDGRSMSSNNQLDLARTAILQEKSFTTHWHMNW